MVKQTLKEKIRHYNKKEKDFCGSEDNLKNMSSLILELDLDSEKSTSIDEIEKIKKEIEDIIKEMELNQNQFDSLKLLQQLLQQHIRLPTLLRHLRS